MLSKEALVNQKFGVEDVELPGLGTVRVRALTRSEALEVRGKELPVEEMERYLISRAMVEPKMTEDDVKAWQDVAPAGQLEPITQAITRLSGMEKTASKEAVQRFRE